MIYLDSISLSLNHRVLIQPLSILINDGSFTAIIGHNGAGKTILLKIIAMLLKPTTGRVMVNGINLALLSVEKRARLISYLAPYIIDSAHFTAFETVLSGLYPLTGQFTHRDPSSHYKAMNYLDEFKLAPLAHQSFNTLSEGERAKVLLCRSLMTDCPYIMIDEMSANLDFLQEEIVFRYLQNLTPKKTIIAIVHNLSLASCYASHLIAIKSGSIIAEGVMSRQFNQHLIKECFNSDVRLIPHSEGIGYHIELKN